jgi:plasmid stabilization system protein ParE
VNFDFLLAARAELEDAFDYYQTQAEGLGFEFAQEVYRAIQLILDHPLAWSKLSKHTRRCRTRRFPYGVVYQVRTGTILNVAVMHLSRKPNYWKHRL